jgi:site-specific recombinase XerC
MSTDLILSPTPGYLPAQLYAPTPQAAKRVLEFFTAQINNDHTRRAYLNASKRFADWCDKHGLRDLVDVEPIHVAAFVKDLQGSFSAPTVKQHLAALRMLFDWLVTGHIIETNPAHAVRGPKYVVKRGKTPVLASDEARQLLDSIDASTLKGLRDRALIGVMVYTFARVNLMAPLILHRRYLAKKNLTALSSFSKRIVRKPLAFEWCYLHRQRRRSAGCAFPMSCHPPLEPMPWRCVGRSRSRAFTASSTPCSATICTPSA